MNSDAKLLRLIKLINYELIQANINALEARDMFVELLCDAQLQMHEGDREKATENFIGLSEFMRSQIRGAPEVPVPDPATAIPTLNGSAADQRI